MKQSLLYFLLIICIKFCAQEKPQLIIGTVNDSLGIVKNVNVLNLNTKLGTFTNNEGLYRIYASNGDTLLFSSIQHKQKKIFITEDTFLKQKINITLISNVYNLNEIIVKKNNLKGVLATDIKQLPKVKRDSILKENLDFTNIDFGFVDTRIDNNIRAKPKITIVDPNQKFEGANLLGFLSLKKKKYKPKEKNIFDKSEVPDKLLNQLGKDYFFKNLKIPEQKYHHFLEFCDLSYLINLYKKGKLLELIQILQDKSKPYLKSIKQ